MSLAAAGVLLACLALRHRQALCRPQLSCSSSLAAPCQKKQNQTSDAFVVDNVMHLFVIGMVKPLHITVLGVARGLGSARSRTQAGLCRATPGCARSNAKQCQAIFSNFQAGQCLWHSKVGWILLDHRGLCCSLLQPPGPPDALHPSVRARKKSFTASDTRLQLLRTFTSRTWVRIRLCLISAKSSGCSPPEDGHNLIRHPEQLEFGDQRLMHGTGA